MPLHQWTPRADVQYASPLVSGGSWVPRGLTHRCQNRSSSVKSTPMTYSRGETVKTVITIAYRIGDGGGGGFSIFLSLSCLRASNFMSWILCITLPRGVYPTVQIRSAPSEVSWRRGGVIYRVENMWLRYSWLEG